MIIEIELNGNILRLKRGNCALVNQVQKILGLDVFQDATKIDTDPQFVCRNLDTPEKIKQLVSVIIDGEMSQDILDSLTHFDITAIVNVFFTDGLKINMKFKSVPPASAVIDQPKGASESR